MPAHAGEADTQRDREQSAAPQPAVSAAMPIRGWLHCRAGEHGVRSYPVKHLTMEELRG